MPYSQELEKRDPHAWLVFGVISAVYFFVYFHRVSTSVIVQDLLTTFETDATALGFMSSMYFYLYALEQPVVGYLSDRLGPRRVVAYWSVVAAFGCIIFGLAPSMGWATIGRGLIGFGVGGVYVPALKAFSERFRQRDFATLTGLLLSVGNLGAIIATTPLAWMASRWGWRSSFLIIGGVTLLLACATLLLLNDQGQGSEPGENAEKMEKKSGEITTAQAVSAVLGTLRFWVLSVIFFGFFGAFLTFQGLWATPFLMSALNLTRFDASQLNMLIPIGSALGAPLFGWLVDRVYPHKVRMLIMVLAVQAVLWVGLTYGTGVLGKTGISLSLILMGGTAGGFAAAIWSLVRETTPRPIMGLTTGMLNPAPFLGVAALQVWTGAILDRTGRVGEAYPPEAYKDAFLLCLGVVTVCLLMCVILRKRLVSEKVPLSPSP
jgi:MFS family permease